MGMLVAGVTVCLYRGQPTLQSVRDGDLAELLGLLELIQFPSFCLTLPDLLGLLFGLFP
jgi:hypothetical protein